MPYGGWGLMNDVAEILSVIARADRLATLRDAQAYVKNFTADGEITGSEGTAIGEELVAFLLATWQKETPGTWHVTAGQEFRHLTVDQATVDSVMIMIKPDKTIAGMAFVSQSLVKEHGSWLIQKRQINPYEV